MSARRSGAAILLMIAPLLSACGAAHTTATPTSWGQATSGDLSISQGWVESVDMGGMDMSSSSAMSMSMSSAAYLTINDSGAADALVSASTPAASLATLHRTIESAGDSSGTMVASRSIAIPAHGRATFAPGGDHIMLSGLRASFAVGTKISLTLRFRSGRSITVVLPVINVVDRPGQDG